MKNKEEPSVDLRRGNPGEQADLYSPDCDGPQTTGSLSRPGRTATAAREKPALSLMTNAWLQAQGLVSLKTLWAHLAPLRRTA